MQICLQAAAAVLLEISVSNEGCKSPEFLYIALNALTMRLYLDMIVPFTDIRQVYLHVGNLGEAIGNNWAFDDHANLPIERDYRASLDQVFNI